MTKDFWRGFSSVLDLFPSTQERDNFVYEKLRFKLLSDEEAFKSDTNAIKGDWEAVGKVILNVSKDIDDSNDH